MPGTARKRARAIRSFTSTLASDSGTIVAAYHGSRAIVGAT